LLAIPVGSTGAAGSLTHPAALLPLAINARHGSLHQSKAGEVKGFV